MGSELITDFELSEKDNWEFKEWTINTDISTAVNIPTANVTRLNNSVDDDFGRSDYKFQITATAANKNILVQSDIMPVNENTRVFLQAFVERIGGIASDIDLVVLDLVTYKRNVAGNYVQTGVQTIESINNLAPSTPDKMFGPAYVGGYASYAQIRVSLTKVFNYAGSYVTNFYFASPSIRELPPTESLFERHWNYDSNKSFGAVGQSILDLTGAINPMEFSPALSVDVDLLYQFRNASGGAKDFGVVVRALDASNNALFDILSIPTMRLADNEVQVIYANASGWSQAAKYRLILTGTTAGNTIANISGRSEIQYN
jgi:hypothetical protein